jgi:hypothetical protein
MEHRTTGLPVEAFLESQAVRISVRAKSVRKAIGTKKLRTGHLN